MDQLEIHGHIDPFPADEGPDSILPQLPEPGAITSRTEWPEIGATELQLSNGMRVGSRAALKFASQPLASGDAKEGSAQHQPGLRCEPWS